MKMSPKEVVLAYYDALIDPVGITMYVHQNLYIQWYSTRGYIEIDSREIITFARQTKGNYASLRLEISHIIEEGNTVSVRYTNYVKTKDNPYDEIVLSHSMAIWELKDNLLYRGYVMSHLD
ncbi:nuclear transport factor 2-like protein [Flavobacterium rivuli]|nr:nuclear transport factor 2 family protein [Flavobacterium rivuli]